MKLLHAKRSFFKGAATDGWERFRPEMRSESNDRQLFENWERDVNNMRPRWWMIAVLGLLLCARPSQAAESVEAAVQTHVRQLNADDIAAREAAEQALLQLVATFAAGDVLAALPASNERMPAEMRNRLARIRQALEKEVAVDAVAETRITLQQEEMILADILAALEKQTGNRVLDQRNLYGNATQGAEPTYAIDWQDVAFWKAIDDLAKRANLRVETLTGEEAIGLAPTHGSQKDAPQWVQYEGPFRIEPRELVAIRNLPQPNQSTLQLRLQVAWEPRLTPVRVNLPLATVQAEDEAGTVLSKQTEGELESSITTGDQATDISLLLTLPPRTSERIARFSAKLTALVPGEEVSFEFTELPPQEPVRQSQGGATVTLESIVENGGLWEVSMRLAYDQASGALESHRGWAYRNRTYLQLPDREEPIEIGGMETTFGTENEIGVLYLFEIPAGVTSLEGARWLYHTAGAIVPVELDVELKDIPLP